MPKSHKALRRKTTQNTANPAYRRHRQSGQAIVTLRDPATGQRRDVVLGAYGTRKSKEAYARALAEWKASESRGRSQNISITELLARFWHHAVNYYRHLDGTPTRTPQNIRDAVRPLCYLYGDMAAESFGPLNLKTVRQLMIDGYDHPKYGKQGPLSRGTINRRIHLVRLVFNWGVENQLLPGSVAHALAAVKALKQGRTEARESIQVEPVPVAYVEKTMAHAPPVIADMIRLQLLTGMRSGELVIMRACDIDVTGKVWIYRPSRHKTEHHNHKRIIAIGPQGQLALKRHLPTTLDVFVFSPARQREQIYARRRAERKTRVQPSQQDRRKKKPKLLPGDRYTVASYARAVARAAQAANVPHWHPHQLRHTRATELRRQYGIDAARVVLGHRSAQITETYAELDAAKGIEIMAKIG